MVNAPIIPAKQVLDTPDYRLTIEDWEYAVTKMPDVNCKRGSCYGRGWTGKQKMTGQPLMCACVGYWELLHEPEGGGTEDGPQDNSR